MLRSRRSLVQTIGRAARNVNGKAIMYADKITNSMQKAIDETNYRREKQTQYNLEHNKVPTPLNKKISENLVGRSKDFPVTIRHAERNYSSSCRRTRNLRKRRCRKTHRRKTKSNGSRCEKSRFHHRCKIKR